MSITRAAGLGGLCFGVAVAGVNTFLVGPSKPMGSPELSRIVAYYVDHGETVAWLAFIAPIAWVAITLFAAGVVVSTRNRDRGVNGWALFGFAGVVTMIPTFCGVVTADAVLAAGAAKLAANPEYTRTLWDFHMILQILNWTFVAIALAGFGMAAVTAGTAPRLGKVGVAGAFLLLAGATQSVPGLTGERSVLVGLPGFLAWLIFVIGYSWIMVRMKGTDAGADHEPTSN